MRGSKDATQMRKYEVSGANLTYKDVINTIWNFNHVSIPLKIFLSFFQSLHFFFFLLTLCQDYIKYSPIFYGYYDKDEKTSIGENHQHADYNLQSFHKSRIGISFFKHFFLFSTSFQDTTFPWHTLEQPWFYMHSVFSAFYASMQIRVIFSCSYLLINLFFSSIYYWACCFCFENPNNMWIWLALTGQFMTQFSTKTRSSTRIL